MQDRFEVYSMCRACTMFLKMTANVNQNSDKNDR